MKKITQIVLILLLSACSSVPLGSIIKIAAMDSDDITAIDPQQIRAKITVDAPTELQTKNVQLVLRFEFFGEAESEYKFLLKLDNNQKVKQQKHWYSGEVERFEYVFMLEDSSIDEFKKYQRDFFKYGKPEKYYWTVYYYLQHSPPKGELINLDLELKLADREDYFYLLRDASVDE